MYSENEKISKDWSSYLFQGSYCDTRLIVEARCDYLYITFLCFSPRATFSFRAEFHLRSSLNTNNCVAAGGFV